MRSVPNAFATVESLFHPIAKHASVHSDGSDTSAAAVLLLWASPKSSSDRTTFFYGRRATQRQHVKVDGPNGEPHV